ERFAGQDYLAMLAEPGGPGSQHLPTLGRVVTLGRELGALWDLGATVDDAELDAAQRGVAPDGVACILYTPGPSSPPKGVQPPPAMRMVMELGAREICNVYGLTECYGNCTVTDAHDPAAVRCATVGYPLPGMELRIVHRETRRPLPAGEVGEILVRGYLTPGYYKDPEKNAAAFDRDGFLLTGELGAIGDDGRLQFRGRLKEMVKTGGINVAPLEIEEVLLGHPAVEQAYVVGLPDPR